MVSMGLSTFHHWGGGHHLVGIYKANPSQTRPAGACGRPMGAAELLRDLGDATMGRGVPAMWWS